MQSILNQSYSLAIVPDSDPTGTASFGLNAGMAGLSVAEGDHQFFVRTFYPENVDWDGGGSGPNEGFKFGDFPAFANKAVGTVLQRDWRGELFDIDTLSAIVIEVKAKEAFELTTATGTLTSTGVAITDGDTVTIGATVYQFKTTTAAAYDVTIGANAAASLANLKKAINATGTPGTEYHAGTLIHPTVIAGDITSTTLELSAARVGAAGNSIASTETAATLSFGSATLTGGGETQSPPVPRGLEGTVRIRLSDDLLPGTSDVDFTVSSPCLFTFTVPDGWTPDALSSLSIVFDPSGPAPLGPEDVNAIVTLTLIGRST